MAAYTPGVILQGCFCKETKGGLIRIEECSGKKKISLWLPKEEHIVDAASGIMGEGDCLRREPPGF